MSSLSKMAALRNGKYRVTDRSEHHGRAHQKGRGAGLSHQPTSRGQRREITFDAVRKALSQWQTLRAGISERVQAIQAMRRARPPLGVTDRVLTVLAVLMTFYPTEELSGEYGLIAFPSNTRLSVRARDMVAATARPRSPVVAYAGIVGGEGQYQGETLRARRKGRGGGEGLRLFARVTAGTVGRDRGSCRPAPKRAHLRVTKHRPTVCRRLSG